MERLDRALVNDAWLSAFPQSLLSHLPRIKLDHKLILLKTSIAQSSGFGRPFRFLAGWTKHVNIPSFVYSKWNYSSDMS